MSKVLCTLPFNNKRSLSGRFLKSGVAISFLISMANRRLKTPAAALRAFVVVSEADDLAVLRRLG
jgi:hypothetical protein